MLNDKIKDLINNQVNKELYSAYLYLGFSTWFEDAGLSGFANWYNIQAQEERDHAMLFFKYLQNNGHRPVLSEIECPKQEYEKPIDVLKAGMNHELYVTSLVNTIYDAAFEAKDYRTISRTTPHRPLVPLEPRSSSDRTLRIIVHISTEWS